MAKRKRFDHSLKIVGQDHIVRIKLVDERFEFDVYEKATEFNEENHIGYFWSYSNEPLADFIRRLAKLTSESFKKTLHEIIAYYIVKR